VTDSSTTPATTSQALTIRIGAPLVISNPSLFDGVVGISLLGDAEFNGCLGNTTWSVVSGALPPGISISSAGVLSGTPTTITSRNSRNDFKYRIFSSPAQTTTISGNIHVAPVLALQRRRVRFRMPSLAKLTISRSSLTAG